MRNFPVCGRESKLELKFNLICFFSSPLSLLSPSSYFASLSCAKIVVPGILSCSSKTAAARSPRRPRSWLRWRPRPLPPAVAVTATRRSRPESPTSSSSSSSATPTPKSLSCCEYRVTLTHSLCRVALTLVFLMLMGNVSQRNDLQTKPCD